MCTLEFKQGALDLTVPKVMGILNVTPDSFSDGGRYLALEQALEAAYSMVEQGAAILDIGGESTRPGAAPVSLDEELRRVIPVIEALSREVEVPLSIDTSKPEVMSAAVEAGASLINDVMALRQPGALQVAADLKAPVCLMHMQGQPGNMQHNPEYFDVVAEVKSFLRQRKQVCREAGIDPSQIILDPGFGFGKTLNHNLKILRYLDEFKELNSPILVGISRKSMLGQLTGKAVEERLPASVAAAVLAAERGAHILRVHDVGPTVDALKILEAVRSGE